MTSKKATATMRRCIGSERFGIAEHEAPVAEFPKQPSQKDGIGRMCVVHWKAYVKGLRESRKPASGTATDLEKPTTKRERRRTPMANVPKPESPRVRKARETLVATEALAGPAYIEAVGSAEVQAALETVNGHGTSEPEDGQVLVAGVLYDSETLEEVPAPDETPLGEIIDGDVEAADAA